jgi:hypothetical protein
MLTGLREARQARQQPKQRQQRMQLASADGSAKGQHQPASSAEAPPIKGGAGGAQQAQHSAPRQQQQGVQAKQKKRKPEPQQKQQPGKTAKFEEFLGDLAVRSVVSSSACRTASLHGLQCAPCTCMGLAMAAEAHVVLAAQKSGRDAIDDEKRCFREVARKLKLRHRGRTSALGDGLDDFTAGLTTADMSSSDSEATSGAGYC